MGARNSLEARNIKPFITDIPLRRQRWTLTWQELCRITRSFYISMDESIFEFQAGFCRAMGNAVRLKILHTLREVQNGNRNHAGDRLQPGKCLATFIRVARRGCGQL